VGLLFEPGDESACSLQGHVEIVDAEEQEEAVARRRLVRTHQGRMLVRAPLVETEQDRSIRIQDLTKVVMARRRLALAEKRLVPFEASWHVADADDRPSAFHRSSIVGLTRHKASPQASRVKRQNSPIAPGNQAGDNKLMRIPLQSRVQKDFDLIRFARFKKNADAVEPADKGTNQERD
jgi:hypothetical protein